MGLVLLRASKVNSRLTQARANDERLYGSVTGLPGVPSRSGRTAVMPRAATFRPNAATNSVIPGTSWMMMTAGPFPVRYTSRVRPLDEVKGVVSKPSRVNGTTLMNVPIFRSHHSDPVSERCNVRSINTMPGGMAEPI